MSGFAAGISRQGEDRRADDGRRRVQVLDGCVVVDRSIAGVGMRLRLPARVFRGVALVVGREGSTEPLVSLVLVHADPDLDVVLYQADHDGDVAAEWQHWAGQFGLPLLVAEPAGGFSEPFPHLGALRVEAPAPRRRPSSLSRRRPRFLSRRRAATLAETPVVHHEREIIGQD